MCLTPDLLFQKDGQGAGGLGESQGSLFLASPKWVGRLLWATWVSFQTRTPHLCWLMLSPPPVCSCGPLCHFPLELPEIHCAQGHTDCPCPWVCCCVPVRVAVLRVGPGASGSDSASGPGSGPAAVHSMCALGRLSCVYAPWQYLWATVSLSDASSLSCPFHICLCSQSQIEPGLPLPLPPPPFLQT